MLDGQALAGLPPLVDEPLDVVDRDSGEPAVFAEELDRRGEVRLHRFHVAPATASAVQAGVDGVCPC